MVTVPAVVAAVARSTVMVFGMSASTILAQVRVPLAAMVVAKAFAPQSDGFAASAVAVPAFPEIVVWSPVLVPDDVPEKLEAESAPAIVRAPADVILFDDEKN